MTDTQSPTTESQTTIDDARARSRRSFIAVLKANRDVFSNLPERIEQWLEEETRATNQPEATKHGRDESDRLARSDMEKQLECFQAEINANTQSLTTLDQTVREMTAALEAMKSVHSSMVITRDRCVERELKEKEDTIEANKEQLKLVEEENLILNEELKKKEKEAKEKITKQEERITRLESEQEKKERQIIEIAREEKEKTEGLTNEHQKEVDELLREIQAMKEKLLKKGDYIQKMYEDYNKNLADHKSRNDTLLKELDKREEEIAKYTQIIARLESEQEKKERQIIEITKEEKEKTEGLTNEHQKEVDKLLREIQTMKEKNDTLLKEKEEEIAKYTEMNLKLKEEFKQEEKEAKKKLKEQEERIALLEGEQEKKERKIVEIAREVEEKTEGLTNEHQKEVGNLLREIQTMKGKNNTLLKEKKEEITKYTEMNLKLKEKLKKEEKEAKEKIKEREERIARLEGELEKKERQITEITRKEKEKTESLTNEHQKEVNKLLGEIQKVKGKNLKLDEELKKEKKEAEEKIKEQEERITLLEGEQEKKERKIVEIAKAVEEKTGGLTNEHQKEVDKLLREIQTMKEKNFKPKQELKKKEEEAKEKIKELEEKEDVISVLEKRKQGDLVKHLNEELAKKDERISELLSHYKTQKECYKSSNDKYIAEIKAMEDELKESQERISWLESKLNSSERMSTMTRETPLNGKPTSNVSVSTMTDIEGKEDSERFEEMERKYQEMTLKRNEEINNLQHSLHRMEEDTKSIISRKDGELNEMKLSLHRMEEDAKSIISIRDGELNQMKLREKGLIEKCRAILESKDEELRGMKKRVAHLNEKLVRKDQRMVEDIAAVNRPSKVEEDFADFFDNERMDAIEKMHDFYGSEEVNDIGISYPRLACMIFEAAYEKTTEAKDSALHVFREAINEMIKKAAELGEAYSLSEKSKLSSHEVTLRIPTYSQELKYSTEVLDTLLLSLKETAPFCSLEFMKEDVRKRVTEKWTSWFASEKLCKFSFSNHLLFQLMDYIKACILLTWRMVVQVPPMQLEYKCTTLKNFHMKVGYHSGPEMCSRSPPNGQGAADDEIACYLWPALLDGGGRVIRRGEVLCKVKAEAV